MRRCPACDIRLVRKKVRTDYKADLVIDQCPGCGGIWFDRGELYRVGKPFAEEMEGTPPSPEAELAGRAASKCPGCGKYLSRLREKRYPETLHVWYCPACGGLWMSEEDVDEFYRFRAKLQARLRAREKERLRQRRRGRPAQLILPSTVEKEMQKDLVDKIVKPAVLLAMPVWAIIGATLIEHLLPFIKRRRSERRR